MLKDVLQLEIKIYSNKICKCMILISKHPFIDKLDYIANTCNNIYHRAMKVEPLGVKDNTYIEFGKESNDKHKFQVGNHVRTSKYENIFAKGYNPSWSK